MEGLLVFLFLGFVLYRVVQAMSGSSRKPTIKAARVANRRPESSGVSSASITITVSGPSTEQSKLKPVDPDRVWVPADRSVEIGGYVIHGGMLYVGEYLQSAGGPADTEPALINPRLDVDRAHPDRAGSGMSYWPSYDAIAPTSRAAYLEWLAGGRCAPDAYIGYVFLYFYGLERRALADARMSPSARHEVPAIVREVERLLSLYSRQGGSFRGYAAQFLEAVQIIHAPQHVYEPAPPETRLGWEMPMSVRLAIGQLAAQRRPIPADWALPWVLLHPTTHLRTPARRCDAELRALFSVRYAAKYGEGIRAEPVKPLLDLRYSPASLSLPRDSRFVSHDVSDVACSSSALNELRRLVDECTNDLEPYSRLLGRRPASRGGLAAIALLPVELVGQVAGTPLSALRSWIGGVAKGAEVFDVPATDLMHQWPGAKGDKLSAKDAMLLAQLLEKLGYGLEPDPRFGGAALKAGETAVMFRLGPDAPKTPSPQYRASTTMLHLGVAVSHADGSLAESERESLLSHVESAMHLTDGERRRLRAHLAWLIHSLPGLAGLRKRIETLPATQKQALAAFCIGVAGADGKVDPAEIRILTKLYPMLGFSADDVYGHLHTLMSGPGAMPGEGTVAVQVARRARTGFVVPPPEHVKREIDRGVSLDMKAVHAKLRETAEVSALLSTIFVEEALPTPAAPVPDAGSRIGSLDGAHSRLLRILVEQGEISRSEFEELAASLGLLPDGALEMINDAAFEACEAIICDGDDPIRVDPDIAKEMSA